MEGWNCSRTSHWSTSKLSLLVLFSHGFIDWNSDEKIFPQQSLFCTSKSHAIAYDTLFMLLALSIPQNLILKSKKYQMFPLLYFSKEARLSSACLNAHSSLLVNFFPFLLDCCPSNESLITLNRILSLSFGLTECDPNSKPKHRDWAFEPGGTPIARTQVAAHILCRY